MAFFLYHFMFHLLQNIMGLIFFIFIFGFSIKASFQSNQINIYIYIYKSRDLMWKSIRFCQVAYSMQRELKYFQVPHQKEKNKLNIDFLFHLVQCFKTFISHTYTQNSFHFNSPLSPLALLPLYTYPLIAFHAIPY